MQKFHKQKTRWEAREIFRTDRKHAGQTVKLFHDIKIRFDGQRKNFISGKCAGKFPNEQKERRFRY